MRIWIAGFMLVSACTEAVPVATKVEPVQAAPVAPAVKTPPVVDGGPTPALACDLTGTWAIEVLPQDDEGCAGLKDEKLTLALGFTAGPSGTRLASAAQAVEGGDGLARMLPAIRSARVVEPRLECGLRVDLGPGADATSHAQLLLQLERGELAGVGTWWGEVKGKRCVQSLSVFGKRSAATPAAWAELGATVPAPPAVPAPPVSAEVMAAVGKLEARALLGGVAVKRPAVKLRGTLVEYVAAVVEGPKSVELVDVACSGPAAGEARCVAVVGEPCRAGLADAGEDCEGMYLTVVVDPRSGALDRADAGGYPVETQADVEERLAMAP